MKKFVILFALIAILATGTVFADHPGGWGVGVVGFWPGGAGLSLKAPMLPVFWAINLGFNSDYVSFGLTGDYYIFDQVLVSDAKLHWFLGVGGFFDFYSYSVSAYGVNYSYTNVGFGVRVPVGLSWQPLDLLEIFADLAPSLGLHIKGEGKYTYNNQEHIGQKAGAGFGFWWPIEIGIRLWF